MPKSKICCLAGIPEFQSCLACFYYFKVCYGCWCCKIYLIDPHATPSSYSLHVAFYITRQIILSLFFMGKTLWIFFDYIANFFYSTPSIFQSFTWVKRKATTKVSKDSWHLKYFYVVDSLILKIIQMKID